MERITYSEYYEVSIAVVEQCAEHNNAVKLTEQFLFSSLEHSGIAVNSGAIKTHLNSPCTKSTSLSGDDNEIGFKLAFSLGCVLA